MVITLGPSTSRRSFNSSNKPSWLISSLSDVEERMKALAMNQSNEEDGNNGDTFAERAEAYYRKRPQLLALLQDLYNSYVTLSDRYMQANPKTTPTHKRHLSQTSTVANDINTDIESDAESSLSYQPQQGHQPQDHDSFQGSISLVTELVAKGVEAAAAAEEAQEWERRFGESARKAELQSSLLEVLESERVVLLGENARLAAEAHFMRRWALARMREEQRICMLSRKIVELQSQVFSLEKRNREFNSGSHTNASVFSTSTASTASTASTGSYASSFNKNMTSSDNEVVLEGCFKMTRKIKLNHRINKMVKKSNGGDEKNIKKKIGLWGRVKSMDLLFCGVRSGSA